MEEEKAPMMGEEDKMMMMNGDDEIGDSPPMEQLQPTEQEERERVLGMIYMTVLWIFCCIFWIVFVIASIIILLALYSQKHKTGCGIPLY